MMRKTLVKIIPVCVLTTIKPRRAQGRRQLENRPQTIHPGEFNMSFWNGTRMRTGWLRLRGNAGGRRRAHWQVDWFCFACQKKHGWRVTRTKALDGNDYCDRQYYKLDHQAMRAVALAKIDNLTRKEIAA
jgi:hypothetical protein